MAEPKKQLTLLSRMGFSDGDLTTPLHDEIMFWLDAGLRTGDLMNSVHEQLWEPAALQDLQRCHWSNEMELRQSIPWKKETREKAVCSRVTWEQAVVTGKDNKFIVGYVDLAVEIVAVFPQIELTHGPACWSVPGTANPQNPIRCSFEVKSRIPSLGEVIRQIRTYQAYNFSHWFVVCPDDRFAAALKEQGIQFLKYEPAPAKVT
jgi:hypothetical protein